MTELLLLTVHFPGAATPVLGGFVLTEEGSEDCTIDFYCDWTHLSPHEADVLDSMESALRKLAQECKNDGRDFVGILESQFANIIRCGERLRLASPMSITERRRMLRAAFGLDGPTTTPNSEG